MTQAQYSDRVNKWQRLTHGPKCYRILEKRPNEDENLKRLNRRVVT